MVFIDLAEHAMFEAGTTTQTFILCELAGAIYGVPAAMVQHIEMVERITPIPNAPAAVEGVVFSRGQVIPVLNLRRRFGFEPIAHDIHTRLVVIHTGGRTVGLLVDTAREFITIPHDAVQPPPEPMNHLSGDYLEGIANISERLILILRVDELLISIDGLDHANPAD
jgi:purine-binding chemotaxis protein CheW